MPYWQSFFEHHKEFNVQAFVAGSIYSMDLTRVEALLVRSTTKVDMQLLDQCPNLKMVGTATAGIDHLNISELEQRNIRWASAGGCNAHAVAQYVVVTILELAKQDRFLIRDKTIAIVGYGNVGSTVYKQLSNFGCDIRVYDPPKCENSQNNAFFCSFDELIEADIICLHAPLNSEPNHPSFHLFDESVISNLKASQYLINAGRGELIDNSALERLYKTNSVLPHIVLDVWENEPHYNVDLTRYCRLATPHIAGHTLEGKALGTQMLYEYVCRFCNIDETVMLNDLLPDANADFTVPDALQTKLNDDSIEDLFEIQSITQQVCSLVYDITNDDSVFRRYMAQSTRFAMLRQNYPIRREFSSISIQVANKNIQELLRRLGFIISNGSAIPNKDT